MFDRLARALIPFQFVKTQKPNDLYEEKTARKILDVSQNFFGEYEKYSKRASPNSVWSCPLQFSIEIWNLLLK